MHNENFCVYCDFADYGDDVAGEVIVDSGYEECKIVKVGDEFKIKIVGDNIAYSNPIKYCPFCGYDLKSDQEVYCEINGVKLFSASKRFKRDEKTTDISGEVLKSLANSTSKSFASIGSAAQNASVSALKFAEDYYKRLDKDLTLANKGNKCDLNLLRELTENRPKVIGNKRNGTLDRKQAFGKLFK